MSVFFDNKVIELPGTYIRTRIQESGVPTFARFNVAAIVGEHFTGPVYSTTPADIITMIPAYSSPDEAAKIFSDGDMVTQFRQLRKRSNSPILFIGIGKFINAITVIKDDATPTPATVCTLTTKNGGIPQNAITISIVAVGNVKTVTITPPHLVKKLTADALTGVKVIKLVNVDGLYPGQKLYISKTGTAAPVQITIESVDSVNKTVTLTTGLGSAFSTANFSFIFDKNIAGQEKKAFDTMTIEQFVNWINSESKIFSAVMATGANTPPAPLAEIHIGGMTGATVATNTALTDLDWENFSGAFLGLAEAFYAKSKLKIRHLLAATPTEAHHEELKTMAVNMRAENWPIQVWAGVALGDHNQSESAEGHPITRAKARNTNDFILAGHGGDGLAAYLSLAPRTLGNVLSAATYHNLTNDELGFTEVEKIFGTANKLESERWLKAGVLFCISKSDTYRICRGVNTFQDQSKKWNVEEKKSFLIQQTQLCDSWNQDLVLNVENLQGSDDLTESIITTRVVGLIRAKIESREILEGSTISSITKVPGGWSVVCDVKFPDADDFMLLTTNILAN